MPSFVYLLECRGGTLYCGWTTDLAARLAAHQAGRGGRYTRSRLPVRLVYSETHPTATDARRREVAIKKLHRSAKLALIAAKNKPAAASEPLLGQPAERSVVAQGLDDAADLSH
jgi:putative endonuclease